MSDFLYKSPSDFIMAPGQIKRLISSLQEVCTARNVDLRTTGTAKTQHIMAEALGYESWQELIAFQAQLRNVTEQESETEFSEKGRFVLSRWQQQALMASRSGRWAMDEVILFDQWWQFLTIVDGYANAIILELVDNPNASGELNWQQSGLRDDDRPPLPYSMRLWSVEASNSYVKLEIGEEGRHRPEFTVDVSVTIEDGCDCFSDVDVNFGTMKLHSWDTYTRGLSEDQTWFFMLAYEPEITKAIEDANVW